MLEKEFKYYLDNQDQIVTEYNGKYVVIVGEKVVNAFDSLEEAYSKSLEEYEEGKFLIQLCTPGEEAYTATFHSRVY